MSTFDLYVGKEIFLFSTISRAALGHIQPPKQRVQVSIFPVVTRPECEADELSPSSAEGKTFGAIPLIPHIN
jgi:hypothetical protein